MLYTVLVLFTIEIKHKIKSAKFDDLAHALSVALKTFGPSEYFSSKAEISLYVATLHHHQNLKCNGQRENWVRDPLKPNEAGSS